MFDNSKQVKRFCRAVELGFDRMETMRRARYKFLAQYVGPFFAKTKTASAPDLEEKKSSPINLMYNAVTTVVSNLVYNDPKSDVSTSIQPYRSYADGLQLATDELIRKIKLRHTLRMAVTDSLFGPGVIKTGLAVSDQTLNLPDGSAYNIGRPIADRVDLDDLVIDPLARNWHGDLSFVGNRVRMRKQDLLELNIYPADKIEKLTSRYEVGGRYNTESASLSSSQQAREAQEIADYVDLVELYLPKEQVIVTVPWNGEHGNEDVLRVNDYDGPEEGPYHLLGYAWVPDNPMPVPPASIWYWLHILANRIARKISRQAERGKRVLAYEGKAFEDAQRVVDADDGESIKVDDVEALKELNYGGTTEDSYKYMEWVQQEFSKQAGNIDLLGGVGADQPTATQSEMLQSNSSIRVADMQNGVYTFAGEVIGALAYYVHTDPLIDLRLTKRIAGADVPFRYTPEMREGTFFDYAIKCRAYSMARTDPTVQLQHVMTFFTSALPAIAQAYQALGPVINLEGAINLVLRKIGIDESDELINSQMLAMREQMEMQLAGQPDGRLGAMMGVPPGGGGGVAPPLPGGGRPNQPNPSGRGPDGGTSEETMRNQRQQRTAGTLQQAYLNN